jgi:AcrR family transcriptional regulator
VPSDSGLRERKKAATRLALSTAALRLAAQRGAAQVTVEDIAAEAGTSTRTFFNYFPTKEAAFVGDDLDRAQAFVTTVVEAPAGTPIWTLLRDTAVETMAARDSSADERALKESLARSDPAFLAWLLAAYTRLENELVVELGRRLPHVEAMEVRLLSNATSAAVRAATETWLETDAGTPEEYVGLLRAAFDRFAPALGDV